MFLHFVMFKDEHVRKKSFSYSGPLHIYIFFFSSVILSAPWELGFKLHYNNHVRKVLQCATVLKKLT